jgi:hypothetical protein
MTKWNGDDQAGKGTKREEGMHDRVKMKHHETTLYARHKITLSAQARSARAAAQRAKSDEAR